MSMDDALFARRRLTELRAGETGLGAGWVSGALRGYR
jgi:hypothetical protein